MNPIPESREQRGWLGWILGVCLGIAAICAVLYPAMEAAREAARRTQCVCNFCGIKLALLNYQSTFGTFPPAYLTDATGKPIHSWRVLILPWMEQSALYDQYNFSEPWDGPGNVKLLDQMPRNLACPSHQSKPTLWTNYVAITGPGTAFPGTETRSQSDITDGTENTLFLAETTSMQIPWTAPIDLEIGSMSFQPNDQERMSISSKHPGGANVVAADGIYRFLKDSVNPDDLRAFLTIAGGERVEIDKSGEESQPVHAGKR